MNLKKLSFFILVFLQICTLKLFSEKVTFSAAQDIFSNDAQNARIATSSSGRYVYATFGTIASRIGVVFSSDFGVTWTDADPGFAIFGNGSVPEIKTDTSGQFVCVIFQAGAGATGAIKTFVSSDFGVTWTESTDGSFGSGRAPAKIMDNSGQFIYATWENTTDYIITFVSADFGVTWTDTTSVAIKGNFPVITTNSTGEFVYLIFPDLASNAITGFVSSDFGQTWTNTTFSSFGVGKDSPAIVTNSSGQIVYGIWSDYVTDEIKIFITSNFGATWRQATTAFGDGFNPQITTDNLGKFIYAIWRQADDLIIYASQDFGVTWKRVSDSFGDGFNPSIITDSSGRYVYAIWREAGASSAIKLFYSTDFGNTWVNADPSATLFGTGNVTQITTNSSGRYAYGIWESPILDVTAGIRSFFPITDMSIDR
ncbi:MAG: hypothetical protein K1000chlam1_00590 [Candidatus Anoxychlamydiales bacterium]|nr:hypothetical protein [Candidatus Anoxychlamydiales bacterium]